MSTTTRLLVASGEAIGGHVYGTIVVMGVIAAGAGGAHGLWNLSALVVTTALVFWLAHVYAHGLEHAVQTHRRLDARTLTEVARHELPIVLSAVGPTVALVAGALGVFRDTRAVWLALALGLGSLAFQGLRYARSDRVAGLVGTIVVVCANVALGLAIVVLKVAVGH